MKAIMISIKPKWVAKILNGIKTKEIRKLFPKNFRGWVYIYCTKEKWKTKPLLSRDIVIKPNADPLNKHNVRLLNGKVVAKFWCDKVEEIDVRLGHPEIYVSACVDDLWCLDNGYHDKNYMVNAIHITKLEIFDKPKELNEFKKYYRSKGYPQNQSWNLTKAPQSWCYVEVE